MTSLGIALPNFVSVKTGQQISKRGSKDIFDGSILTIELILFAFFLLFSLFLNNIKILTLDAINLMAEFHLTEK